MNGNSSNEVKPGAKPKNTGDKIFDLSKGPVTLGRYKLLSILGEGGLAQVYRAELHGPMGFTKQVAIKVIKTGSQNNAAIEHQSFIREARLGGLLRHPNIVDIYELFEFQGHFFIVMEVIEGWSLRTIIKKTPSIPLPIILQIGQHICEALEEAHSLQIKGKKFSVIHRDIKPSNVMLNHFGQVKVVDFGIALLTGDPSQQKMVFGTPAYMAPEQILNSDMDGRADIFSLGVVLYEMTTGERLFRGPVAEMIEQRLQVETHLENPQPWVKVDSKSTMLRAILEKALRAHPSDRFESARDFGQALRTLEEKLNHRYRLADWTQQIHTHGIPALSSEPDLKSLDVLSLELDSYSASTTNLPNPVGGFFGRRDLFQRLQKHLSVPGLVTLLGLGGIGKTRLAVETGFKMLSAVPGGVWFCDMVAAKDGTDFLNQVAAVLHMRLEEGPAEEHVERLGKAIANRGRVIMILDNLEQIAEDIGEWVRQWISAAGEASFLITTREPLHLHGEQIVRIGPMSPPEAEEMFRDRSARPLEQDEPSLPQLVTQLDGIPLAIELAARRTRVLTPRQLLSRLNQRFRLLRREGKTNDRHNALAVILDSSYNALDRPEQEALAQCAVFRGGFDVDAAETVIDLTEHQARWAVDSLSTLVDYSLVQVIDGPNHEKRFTLLVSVAEYAQGKFQALEETVKSGAIKRHAMHYSQYGEEMWLGRAQNSEIYLQRALYADEENIRQAAQNAIDHSWPEIGARLCLSLRELSPKRGRFTESIAVTNALLQLQISPRNTIRLLRMRSWFEYCIGQTKSSEETARAALRISRREKYTDEEASCLARLASTLIYTRKQQTAWEHLQTALTINRTLGRRKEEGKNILKLGWICMEKGQQEEALKYVSNALEIFQKVGGLDEKSTALNFLARINQNMGNPDVAKKYFERAIAVHRKVQNLRAEGICLGNLASLQREMGQLHTAERSFQRALHLGRRVNDRRNVAIFLGNLGILYLQMGQFQKASPVLDEALQMHRTMSSPRHEASVLCTKGNLNLHLNQLTSALECYTQAFHLQQELGTKRMRAVILGNIGFIHERLGNGVVARNHYLDAIAQHVAIKNPAGEQMDRLRLGHLCFIEHQISQAEKQVQVGLAIGRKTQDPIGLCWGLILDAQIKLALGELNLAVQQLNELQSVLEPLESQKSSRMVMSVSELQFIFQSFMLQTAGYRENAQGTVPIPEEDRSRPSHDTEPEAKALALTRLAQVKRKVGLNDACESAYRQALEIYEELRFNSANRPLLFGLIHLQLATLCGERGAFDEASKHLSLENHSLCNAPFAGYRLRFLISQVEVAHLASDLDTKTAAIAEALSLIQELQLPKTSAFHTHIRELQGVTPEHP